MDNINEFIFGVDNMLKMNENKGPKDVYDVQIQCKLDDENKSDSDDEILIPSNIQKGHRKSMVNLKTKNAFVPVKKTEDEKIKTEKGDELFTNPFGGSNKVLNDDLKKQILSSVELNDFLTKNSKYIERVIDIIY